MNVRIPLFEITSSSPVIVELSGNHFHVSESLYNKYGDTLGLNRELSVKGEFLSNLELTPIKNGVALFGRSFPVLLPARKRSFLEIDSETYYKEYGVLPKRVSSSDFEPKNHPMVAVAGTTETFPVIVPMPHFHVPRNHWCPTLAFPIVDFMFANGNVIRAHRKVSNTIEGIAYLHLTKPEYHVAMAR